jgi:hypothetical protein
VAQKNILIVEADNLATESQSMKPLKNINPNFATASLMTNEILLTADYKKYKKCLLINGPQGIYDE